MVFFFQNVIEFPNVVPYGSNISVWNWSNTTSIYSALSILMAWCFSTSASVATVLSTHSCVYVFLLVKEESIKCCWNIFCSELCLKLSIFIQSIVLIDMTYNMDVYWNIEAWRQIYSTINYLPHTHTPHTHTLISTRPEPRRPCILFSLKTR